MGVFDTIQFQCPNCAGLIEIQSKAQPDSFNHYEASETPVMIAVDILGSEADCGGCGKSFRVNGPFYPPTVGLWLTERTS